MFYSFCLQLIHVMQYALQKLDEEHIFFPLNCQSLIDVEITALCSLAVSYIKSDSDKIPPQTNCLQLFDSVEYNSQM